MSRFPTQRHLISWAGLCPRNDESAGKRRSNRMRKGAPWLKTTLIQCAWGQPANKGSYLQAQFHRLRARRGAKKAIGAVAASMLTAAYHMLKDGPSTKTSAPTTSTPRQDRPHPTAHQKPQQSRLRRTAHPGPRMTRV